MFSRKCKAIFSSALKGAAYLVPAIGTGIAFYTSAAIVAETPVEAYSIEGRAVLYTAVVSSLAATGSLAFTSLSYFYEGLKAYRATPEMFVPLENIEIAAENETQIIEAKREDHRCRPGLKSGLYTALFTSTTFTALADSYMVVLALLLVDALNEEGNKDDSKLQINYPFMILRNSSLWFAAINFLVKAIQEGRKSCAPIHTSHATLFSIQAQSRLLDSDTHEESKQLSIVRSYDS